MSTTSPDEASDAPRVRPMTYHERYSLMRQNTGFPHVILWVVTYPSAALPPRAALEARVAALQAAQPILHARVAGADTNKPGYVEGAVWPASAIVREFEGAYRGGAPEEALQVYRGEMARFAALAGAPGAPDAPPWCVGLHARPGAERAYLTLAFNHLVIDGRGSSLLLGAMHGADPVPEETLFSPTRADDTLPMAPTLRFLAPIVFRELLLPKFPLWVQAPFTKDDPWPGHAVQASPFDVPQDIRLLSLAPADVAALKAQGKAHGVRTLHPLLKAAEMAAIWYVHAARGTAKAAPPPADARPALRLAAATARDERDPALGHSAIAHNYVSSTEVHRVLAGGDAWWAFAAGLAADLASDQGLQDGRMTISLLGHVPDPDIAPERRDPKLPTGWEQYFHARAASPTPYRESLAVSNLGLVPLPPQAEDMLWGQTASPYGSPYYANIVGHEGGIRLTSTYRDGSVTDTQHVEQVHDTMRRILARIAEGVDAETTLEQIAGV